MSDSQEASSKSTNVTPKNLIIKKSLASVKTDLFSFFQISYECLLLMRINPEILGNVVVRLSDPVIQGRAWKKEILAELPKGNPAQKVLGTTHKICLEMAVWMSVIR